MRLPFHTLALAALATATASAHAQSQWEERNYRRPSNASCVRMDIQSHGTVLPQYDWRGKRYIEGYAGSEYQILVQNHCARRVLAVLSVDGLNVMDGRRASVNQAGYVLNPGESTEVAGWRKSSQDVASFYFTYPQDSYGNRTARPENVGVIGGAFFYEREYPRPRPLPDPSSRYDTPIGKSLPPGSLNRESMREAPAAAKAEAAPSLGTGHGRIQDSPTWETTFNREANPFFTTTVRYEDRQALTDMGLFRSPSYPSRDAFPRDNRPWPEPQYTPDPPRRYIR